MKLKTFGLIMWFVGTVSAIIASISGYDSTAIVLVIGAGSFGIMMHLNPKP